MSQPLTICLSLTLAACATPSRDLTPAIVGMWGGPHIGLTVADLDADVQLDCAEGTIWGPYEVQRNGAFEWAGTFARGTGGPVRQGQAPAEIGASYFGSINGPQMTLSMKLDDGTTVGPFTLERFKEPQLTRCL